MPYPMTLGHEFVAEITAVGEGTHGFAPGDVVTTDFNHRCGDCDQCRRGRSHLCRAKNLELFTNRAFADTADVSASYLMRLDGPPRPHYALIEPVSCMLHAFDWAAPHPDENVLVVGAGGLGLCIAFILAAQPVPAKFALTEPQRTRLSRLTAASAPVGSTFVGPGEFDVVFDVSGTPAGLQLACARVRPGGRVCSMSHLDGYNADFLLAALTRRDVAFKVSYLNGGRANLPRAAQLLDAAWDDAWTAALEIVPFNNVAEAFAGRGTSTGCKTLVDIGASPS